MKKLFLVFLYFCTSFLGFSQTLHAIVFADTFDERIGESVFQDYERMTIEITNIAAALGYKQKNYFYRDYDYNIDKLAETLDNLQCNANDIVFFYVSSHGGRAENDNSRFPRIQLNNYLISITKIDEAIAQKNPKFRIVMADCCNTVGNFCSDGGVLEDSSQISQTVAINYKTLFAQKGNILMSGSSPSETAVGTQEGGIFTSCFLYELGKTVAGISDAITWDDIFEKVKQKTKQQANHTPIADIHLESSQTITQDSVIIGETLQLNNTNQLEISILDELIILANPQRDELLRIKMIAPLLEKYFATPQAKVEIIAQNGVTLVDRKTAEDYLKFVATTKSLIQLSQLKVEKNSQGKITALKINEIYKD